MNEEEKSLIWDLLIPEKELKIWANKLLYKPLGAIDSETLLQDMLLDCWGKLTNRNFWITSGKNAGRNIIKHELQEKRKGHFIAKDISASNGTLFDEAIARLTTKPKYEKYK